MEKIRQSGNLIPCAVLIVFIVWVLIAGWATATECAAYGVLGSLDYWGYNTIGFFAPHNGYARQRTAASR